MIAGVHSTVWILAISAELTSRAFAYSHGAPCSGYAARRWRTIALCSCANRTSSAASPTHRLASGALKFARLAFERAQQVVVDGDLPVLALDLGDVVRVRAVELRRVPPVRLAADERLRVGVSRDRLRQRHVRVQQPLADRRLLGVAHPVVDLELQPRGRQHAEVRGGQEPRAVHQRVADVARARRAERIRVRERRAVAPERRARRAHPGLREVVEAPVRPARLARTGRLRALHPRYTRAVEVVLAQPLPQADERGEADGVREALPAELAVQLFGERHQCLGEHGWHPSMRMPELAVGATFADHIIRGVAGRGGMGVVYRAVHLALKREVALKVIGSELSAHAEFRARFQRECETAASIQHPRVVPIYHAGEEDGLLYVTMRYVDGTDLARALMARGRLDVEDGVRIVKQVADGLQAAHELGLVHRDVKPANILLDKPTGSRCSSDFGLTKHVGEDPLTREGVFVGTIDYAAPEQFEAGTVDARTDVYALGCVLYQVLSGRVPYPPESDAAKMYAHMQAPRAAAGRARRGRPADAGRDRRARDGQGARGPLPGRGRAGRGAADGVGAPDDPRRRDDDLRGRGRRRPGDRDPAPAGALERGRRRDVRRPRGADGAAARALRGGRGGHAPVRAHLRRAGDRQDAAWRPSSGARCTRAARPCCSAARTPSRSCPTSRSSPPSSTGSRTARRCTSRPS